ncbi:DUF6902 family protein [Tritonibacter aquimaris]|uniref:DUF6902 family protein n=1 Tax=Tritonibacter aquimaris TaxID=2663379 RepID=UPI0038B613B0
MATVIDLHAHQSAPARSHVELDIAACFARTRRSESDVFWLKENAELLNINECAGTRKSSDIFSSYGDFYDIVERRICFFRQYYRFLLSICIDLEDLGFSGNKGEVICEWVRQENIDRSELSDLQRAEVQRLLARRNMERSDPGLNDRLRDFMCQQSAFSLPNIKIAYELTHIVFYLSEYGRKDPQVPAAALHSLKYAGLVAYLDQNMDLLAEICIALRFSGETPPKVWEESLDASLRGYQFLPNSFDGAQDDYHAYFVGSWWAMVSGTGGMATTMPGPGTTISASAQNGVLKPLSVLLYENAQLACRPWSMVRQQVLGQFWPQERQLMQEAESSVEDFASFYQLFARAGVAG